MLELSRASIEGPGFYMHHDMVIFGGTFDPIHHGHLIVALAVAEALACPVTFMPAGRPPHKPAPEAGIPDRLAMLKLAVEGDELLAISDIEASRDACFTYDTVQELRLRGAARIRWVIGTDMLAYLPHWRRYRELLELVEFVVVARPWRQDLPAAIESISGALTRQQLSQLEQNVVAAPLIQISSSEIRRRLHLGLTVRYMTPPAVVEYIAQRALYTIGR